MSEILKRLHFWYINARPGSLPQSLLPALAALALAYSSGGGFSLWLGLSAVLGLELAHLSFNLFDDYFDYRKLQSGFRETLAASGIRARTSKCPYLTSGAADMGELLRACLGFLAAAALCGLPPLLARGPVILWPVGLGLALGLFYSAEPLRLSYRGLGELAVGVAFGPLLMPGVYLAACGRADAQIWPLALAMGLLVTNIVYTHSFLDLEADRFAGKATLAGLLKNPRQRLEATAMFSFLPFGLLALGILAGWLGLSWLLPLAVPLPLAAALYASMCEFTLWPGRRPERRLWYGPMGNWEAIRRNKLDWFMLRWYLSRNLTTLFAICCILAALLGKTR